MWDIVKSQYLSRTQMDYYTISRENLAIKENITRGQKLRA